MQPRFHPNLNTQGEEYASPLNRLSRLVLSRSHSYNMVASYLRDDCT